MFSFKRITGPLIIAIVLLSNIVICFGNDIKSEIRANYDKERLALEERLKQLRFDLIDSCRYEEMFEVIDTTMDKIAELDTTEAEFWAAAAEVYFRFNDYKTARGYYERYFEMGGNSIVTKHDYCFTLIKLDEYESAITVYKEIVSQSPGDYKAAFMMGKLLYLKECYAEAIPCLEAALKDTDTELVQQNKISIYTELMNCYYNTEQPQKVIEMISRLEEEAHGQPSPFDVDIYCIIINSYRKLNNFEKAREYCRKASTLHQDVPCCRIVDKRQ